MVVDGLDKLRDGAQIKVIDRAAQQAGSNEGAGKGKHRQHDASGGWSGKRQHASAAN